MDRSPLWPASTMWALGQPFRTAHLPMLRFSDCGNGWFLGDADRVNNLHGERRFSVAVHRPQQRSDDMFVVIDKRALRFRDRNGSGTGKALAALAVSSRLICAATLSGERKENAKLLFFNSLARQSFAIRNLKRRGQDSNLRKGV